MVSREPQDEVQVKTLTYMETDDNGFLVSPAFRGTTREWT